jgi:S-adenosylmethionine synthetase
MRPKALIDELGLLAPVYTPTSAYGHFGRSEFSWEKVNRAAVMAADLLGGKVKGTKVEPAAAKTNGAHANGTNGTAKKAKPAKKTKASKKDKRSAAQA